MASWDEQITAYENKIAVLEGQLESVVKSASKAAMILSGIALVTGFVFGLLIAAL